MHHDVPRATRKAPLHIHPLALLVRRFSQKVWLNLERRPRITGFPGSQGLIAEQIDDSPDHRV